MRQALLLALALLPTAAADDASPLVRLGSDRFRQAGHVGAITYSPDGKLLATAEGPAVHLWDAGDGRRLRTIPGDDKFPITVLRFRADGAALYAAGLNERKGLSLFHFDPATGKVLAWAVLAPDNVGRNFDPTVQFSPDGVWAAVRPEPARLQVIDTATRRVVWAENGPSGALAFRGDSKVLVIAAADRPVRVLDLGSRAVIHEYPVEGGALSNLAFSPDGKDLVAQSGNPWPNHLVRFDAATGQVRWTFRTERVWQVTFSPDGQAVVYFGHFPKPGPDMWHWLDAATGRPLFRKMDAEYGNQVAIRPDGKAVAIGGYYGFISQWDLDARTRLHASSTDPPGPVTDLRFSPDGSKLIGWARGWYEWDLKSGKQTRRTPELDVGASDQLAASRDDKWLCRSMLAPNLRIESYALTEVATGRRHVLPKPRGADARFLADGRLLVHQPDRLTVYDPETGKQAVQIRVPGRTGAVAAVPDGTAALTVVPAGDHVHAIRWDLATGKSTGEWDGRLPVPTRLDLSQGWSAQMSPDGRLLAVSFIHFPPTERGVRQSPEMYTALFDARTGDYRSGGWDRHARVDLAFSPDGRTMACFERGATAVDVREVVTGGRRARRSGLPVTSAAFGLDGRTLALATSPGPVALWDLIGEPVGRWSDQQPDRLWAGLAREDAEAAFPAIRVLRAHPAEAVAFLKDRMKVPTGPTAEWVADRIKSLDAAGFKEREQASADLAAAGPAVVPALRAALKDSSAEARSRLEALLARPQGPSPDVLRAVRACEVLEGMSTPEARELLAEWARGPTGATLTREATESLDRLRRR